MPKFKVDTASLHDPVEIEIDGQSYAVRPMTYKALTQAEELDKKVEGGDMSALYERLAYLLPGIKPKVIESLEVNHVVDITKFIMQNIVRAKGEVKNAPKPGDGKSQS